MTRIDVYLEVGAKRAFAGAVDWPGWTRGGRDEAAAVQALLDSAERYAQLVAPARLAFRSPGGRADLNIVERLAGNAGTDFGAPNIALARDAGPLDAAALERSTALLQAYWRALDQAIARAEGAALRTGPRGGGRGVDQIIAHVVEADRAYLARVAWKPAPGAGADPRAMLAATRQEILAALEAAARGALPQNRPRGGAVWPVQTFVRRVGWHALDHAWEIEDRSRPEI